MTTSFSGVNVVRKTTTFSLYMQPPNAWSTPYYNYPYSSTGIASEYVLLKFVPKYVIDPYNIVPITCSGCTEVQVFYATGIIRFRHVRSMSGNSPYTFTFNNFPSSAFTISNLPITVNVEIYSNYRLFAYYNTTIATRTYEKCSLFSFGVLSVSSLNGG